MGLIVGWKKPSSRRGWKELTAGKPKGLYRPVLQVGDTDLDLRAFAGSTRRHDRSSGQVGRDLDEVQAAEAAALAMAGVLRGLAGNAG